MISYVLYIKTESRAEAPGVLCDYLCVCVWACLPLRASFSCTTFKERRSDPLELKFHAVVCCSMCILRTELWSGEQHVPSAAESVGPPTRPQYFAMEVEEQTSLLSFSSFSFGDLKCLGFQVWYLLRVKKNQVTWQNISLKSMIFSGHHFMNFSPYHTAESWWTQQMKKKLLDLVRWRWTYQARSICDTRTWP